MLRGLLVQSASLPLADDWSGPGTRPGKGIVKFPGSPERETGTQGYPRSSLNPAVACRWCSCGALLPPHQELFYPTSPNFSQGERSHSTSGPYQLNE